MACCCNVFQFHRAALGTLISLLTFLCTCCFFDNCAIIILMACRNDDRCIALATCTLMQLFAIFCTGRLLCDSLYIFMGMLLRLLVIVLAIVIFVIIFFVVIFIVLIGTIVFIGTGISITGRSIAAGIVLIRRIISFIRGIVVVSFIALIRAVAVYFIGCNGIILLCIRRTGFFLCFIAKDNLFRFYKLCCLFLRYKLCFKDNFDDNIGTVTCIFLSSMLCQLSGICCDGISHLINIFCLFILIGRFLEIHIDGLDHMVITFGFLKHQFLHLFEQVFLLQLVRALNVDLIVINAFHVVFDIIKVILFCLGCL